MIDLFPPRELALGLALPGVLAAVILISARWAGPNRWAAPLAVGLGYLIGHTVILGWPPLPPRESIQWLAPIAVLMMVLGSIDGRFQIPDWMRWAAQVVVSLTILGVLATPLIRNGGEGQPPAWLLVGLVLGLLIAWRGAEALGERLRAATMALDLSAVAFGMTGVLLLSFSLVQAKLGAALTASLVGCLLGSLGDRGSPLARSGIGVALMLLAGLLLDGLFYSEVPTGSALLLGVATFGPWLGLIRRMGRWPTALLGACGVVLPVALALAIAFRRWQEQGTEALF